MYAILEWRIKLSVYVPVMYGITVVPTYFLYKTRRVAGRQM